ARVPVAARAEATVRLTASGWDLETGRGTGKVTIRPATVGPASRASTSNDRTAIPVSGSSRIGFTSRGLTLEGARLAAEGIEVGADLSIGWSGALDGRLEAHVPVASLPWPAAAADAVHPRGALVVEGTVGGSARSPSATLALR